MNHAADDEGRQIRAFVARWMDASKAGDVETLLDLLADDVVFLIPGREPMRKPEFERQSRAQAGAGAPQIDGTAEVQEVQVAGDLAFAWTRLAVAVTPPGGAPIERRGYTLSVFRKVQGVWRLARDANLLVPPGTN